MNPKILQKFISCYGNSFFSKLDSIKSYICYIRNFLKYICIFFFTSTFLTACDKTELNQISIKTIKNDFSGEIEEYRSIKISEDEKNDYYLDIKIPKLYKEASTQYGDFLTVYRFSKGKANQYIHEGILISKTISKYDENIMQTVEGYGAWIDSNYKKIKGKPIFKDSSYGHENGETGHSVKTYTLKYIFPCYNMKDGSICFSGQKVVNIIKILKPNKTIWAIEYQKLIDPIGSQDNYDSLVKETFELGEKLIENCCKILEVKKPEKNSGIE